MRSRVVPVMTRDGSGGRDGAWIRWVCDVASASLSPPRVVVTSRLFLQTAGFGFLP
jgi:flavin reductase (DIM6/NTAB) family NADH-FMN oxidoreductase RutF